MITDDSRADRRPQNQYRDGAHLLAPDQNQVVAWLRAGVATAREGHQAQLPAGGAGPRVAAVRLPGGVMAGGGAPGDTRERDLRMGGAS